MEKSEDSFDKLIESLKKQQPEIADSRKLTEDIMKRIGNATLKRPSLLYLKKLSDN